MTALILNDLAANWPNVLCFVLFGAGSIWVLCDRRWDERGPTE